MCHKIRVDFWDEILRGGLFFLFKEEFEGEMF